MVSKEIKLCEAGLFIQSTQNETKTEGNVTLLMTPSLWRWIQDFP